MWGHTLPSRPPSQPMPEKPLQILPAVTPPNPSLERLQGLLESLRSEGVYCSLRKATSLIKTKSLLDFS